jgi:hypothetical protein
MLYNLKSIKDKFLMTKFSDDLELQASYILSDGDCNCPSGIHGRYCRHKRIRKLFVDQGKVNSEWFYNYDTGKWHLFEELKQEA